MKAENKSDEVQLNFKRVKNESFIFSSLRASRLLKNEAYGTI